MLCCSPQSRIGSVQDFDPALISPGRWDNRKNQLFDEGWLKKIGRNFRSAAIGPVDLISLFILGRNRASAI